MLLKIVRRLLFTGFSAWSYGFSFLINYIAKITNNIIKYKGIHIQLEGFWHFFEKKRGE